MFLFNTQERFAKSSAEIFKYNFCFSSTGRYPLVKMLETNLNTTFVSLQLVENAKNTLAQLDLNTTFVSLQQVEIGERIKMLRYLNTTFVSLQLERTLLRLLLLPNLNTTFVSLQLIPLKPT